MARPNQDLDITRNLRTLEWLKTELIEGVSFFFKALIKHNQQAIAKALATIMLTCYFLGKRLGISYAELDQTVEEQLHSLLETDHQLEKWYGDISTCLNHVQGKNQR
ncbi:MAG: hypothetical protein GX050_05795 [Firmicutes bacterium]|nr:hypothetical protein [Bacillota bacterium]